MSNSLVSIILPSYNHSHYLTERLNSIFNQTCKAIEVIILDDASTDSSVDILSEFKNHPKVTHYLINEQNSGSPFLQWQKGLELAKGDYIWIAESDDACELDFLSTQLECLAKSEASIAVAKTLKYNNGKSSTEINHPIFKTNTSEFITTRHLNFCPILNISACVFINTKKWSDHNEFLKYRLIGDRVFYQEFFKEKKVVKNEKTLSYFRKEQESVSSLKYKSLDYFQRYFKEHLKFLNFVDRTQALTKQEFNSYLNKFFARVRDRLKRRQKLSLTYADIYLSYFLNKK
jgi:glycosyltransferase involved in cell wall biosynthesis